MQEQPDRSKRDQNARLVGLFALGGLLFSFPLLQIAEGRFVFGLPALPVWLFLVWAVFILVLGRLIDHSRSR